MQLTCYSYCEILQTTSVVQKLARLEGKPVKELLAVKKLGKNLNIFNNLKFFLLHYNIMTAKNSEFKKDYELLQQNK